jgi:ATP-dependent Zn protease
MNNPSLEKDNELKYTAFHEAGHVIACCELGLPFEKVSIIPDSQTGNPGRVKTCDQNPINYNDKSPENLKLIACEIMGLLSGDLAEARTRRTQTGKGSSVDYVEAFMRAHNYFGDSATAGDFCLKLRKQAEHLLNSQWPYVKDVAAELLKKKELSAPEVKLIIKNNQDELLKQKS